MSLSLRLHAVIVSKFFRLGSTSGLHYKFWIIDVMSKKRRVFARAAPLQNEIPPPKKNRIDTKMV